MQIDRLLSLLADGRFHSGQSIGDYLGVSRTAVWKQIKKLQSVGVEIDSVHGKGYRLHQSLELLESNKIAQELSEVVKESVSSIEVCLSVESTNTHLMRMVNSHRFICLAEQQTAGRGRRGREWISPFGQNIYLSLGWYFQGGVAQLEGLSLAVAVAVCRALEESGVEDVGLKWPNDLLFQNRKLGGILLEMSGDTDGICKVVVGIGLNVNMSNTQNKIDQPWISVGEIIGKKISRDRLAGKLINQLVLILLQFEDKGFLPFRDEWIKRDLFFEKNIKLVTASLQVEGIEKGVDDRGALCVLTHKGLQKFYGGEVSVRLV